MFAGDEIHGEVHSADASAGVAIVLYNAGSTTPRVLQPYEWVELHSIEVVTAVGGDTFISLDAAANTTPTAGTTAVRATLAANSGIVISEMHFTGVNGNLPRIFAPAGVVDVNFRGYIRSTTEGVRPKYQARLNS